MKPSWGFFFSSIYCLAAAAASNPGHVFLWDPAAKAAPQQSPSLTPEAARLVLAQRLGLSRFHSINNPTDELIQQLNTYGGPQPKLFGSDRDTRTNGHVLVWVEDVEEVSYIIQDASAYSAEFSLSSPPSSSDSDELLHHFTIQAAALPKKPDAKGLTYKTGIDTEATFDFIKAATYNDYLSIVRADKSSKDSYPKLASTLASFLAQNAKAGDAAHPITVVVMPPSPENSKRSANAYGTYDLPSRIEARNQKSEALLSLPTEPTAEPHSSDISDLESFPAISQADESPVLGILPSCFASQEACEKQTHSCSGHGNCTLVRKGETGKDARIKDCYGCQCKATVEFIKGKGMEEFKKTTYWGGPACQKKDISVPFFLFLGVGLLLAFLISASIGALYSMGAEELPSVIGAGVSGPQKK